MLSACRPNHADVLWPNKGLNGPAVGTNIKSQKVVENNLVILLIQTTGRLSKSNNTSAVSGQYHNTPRQSSRKILGISPCLRLIVMYSKTATSPEDAQRYLKVNCGAVSRASNPSA